MLYIIIILFLIIVGGKKKIINELNGLSGQELLLYIVRYESWDIWGKLIRKSIFDNIVLYPVSLGEDLFLICKYV